MHDYLLIVDQYRRYRLARDHKWPIDPASEARRLSATVKMLGRRGEHHVLIDTEDAEGLRGYLDAGFKAHSMNGDREVALDAYFNEANYQISRNAPRNLVVVTDDPEFRHLLATAGRSGQTQIALWVPGGAIPPLFQAQQYNARPLEELIPESKVPRVDVRLDYENLHIGLRAKGWNGDTRAFVRAVRKAFEATGEVVHIVAYADYGLLQSEDKRNWQRELEEAGVETRYLVNERGKNTADMKIADAVRDLLETNAGPGQGIDVIALGTNDRDFKSVIETARQKGKQIKLLSIHGGLSRHLSNVVPEKDIVYIDDFLALHQTVKPNNDAPRPDPRTSPFDSDTGIVVRIAAWLAQQGKRGWTFTTTARLTEALAMTDQDLAQVEKAVAAGKLRRGSIEGPHGREETLGIHTSHPVIKAAQRLIAWAPSRVSYCLDTKGMPYVDTHYLARGMQMDRQLAELGAGQSQSEAEAWLGLLAQAGILAHREQPHPRQPDRTISTWWLPAAEAPAAETSVAETSATEAPTAVTTADTPSASPVERPPATAPARPREKPNWNPFTLTPLSQNGQTGWAGAD